MYRGTVYLDKNCHFLYEHEHRNIQNYNLKHKVKPNANLFDNSTKQLLRTMTLNPRELKEKYNKDFAKQHQETLLVTINITILICYCPTNFISHCHNCNG